MFRDGALSEPDEPANLILRPDQYSLRNTLFSCFLISLLFEAFLQPIAIYSALNSCVEIMRLQECI